MAYQSLEPSHRTGSAFAERNISKLEDDVKILTAFSLLALSVCAIAEPPLLPNFKKGAPDMMSISALANGPDGLLFVGDSIGGRIFALDLNDKTEGKVQERFKITDIESRIASMMGADASDVLIHDMATNPISKNIYLAVSRGRKNLNDRWLLPNDVANASMLLRVSTAGDISEVDLSDIAYSATELPNPIDAEKKHRWKPAKRRVDAITDMDFADGKIYVAGLSNEEFASMMRVLPFPFNNQNSATTLEIYHGAHGAWETNSPVRAFTTYENAGKQHLLASYLCTPLVTFPLENLKDDTHIKGRTLAELGYGNYPLDMITYKRDGEDYVLLINSTRGVMRFKLNDIRDFKGELVTKSKDMVEGVGYDVLPIIGVQQLDHYGSDHIVAISRQPNGSLDLTTGQKKRL